MCKPLWGGPPSLRAGLAYNWLVVCVGYLWGPASLRYLLILASSTQPWNVQSLAQTRHSLFVE